MHILLDYYIFTKFMTSVEYFILKFSKAVKVGYKFTYSLSLLPSNFCFISSTVYDLSKLASPMSYYF